MYTNLYIRSIISAVLVYLFHCLPFSVFTFYLLADDNGLCLAKVKVNSELTPPCNTSILYPADGGNMHRFTAKTACAVLDVLGPPYCDPEGRHCQFYQELPFPQISGTKTLYSSVTWKLPKMIPFDIR